MQTVTTGALDLLEARMKAEDPSARVRVNFPLNKWTGTADSAVVYFEVAPGEHLATHTDSAEEVLYIVTGTGMAEVGDERGRVDAGDLAVIPAMAPTASSTTATRRCAWSASSPRRRSSRRSPSRSTRSASPRSRWARRSPPKTFRIHDSERGTKRIKVNRNTRFERIAGFSAVKPGMRRIEVVTKRKNGRWVATEVERSGGGGEHGGHGADD